MNDEERMAVARELMRQAREDMAKADLLYDPVRVRHSNVSTAAKLRKAADFLDDEGRLQE